jgi:hypothetical protein
MSMYVVEAGGLCLYTCSLDLKEKSEGEMWILDKWKREGREKWFRVTMAHLKGSAIRLRRHMCALHVGRCLQYRNQGGQR